MSDSPPRHFKINYMKNSIKKSYTLPASVKDVFAALTDSKKIKAWSGQAGSVANKVGGQVYLFDGWNKGKVLSYKPEKELSYTWLVDGWDEKNPSVVTFKLSPAKSGAKVDLSHTNLPNEKETRDHASGWDEYFFNPLKEYLEN